MDLDAKIFLTEEIAFQYAGDKVVVMQAEGSILFTLNETGTDIWKLLEKKSSMRDIQSYVEANYDGDIEEKHKEVEAFLQQLIESKLAIIQT